MLTEEEKQLEGAESLEGDEDDLASFDVDAEPPESASEDEDYSSDESLDESV